MNKQTIADFTQKYTAHHLLVDANAASEFASLYNTTFKDKVSCVACPDVMIRAYQRLINYLNSNTEITMSENFEMKEGYQIFLHQEHKVVTAANLTSDEEAYAMLANNAGLIDAFAKFPEDWKAQLEKFKKQAAKEVETKVEEPKVATEPVTEAAKEVETKKPHAHEKGKGK